MSLIETAKYVSNNKIEEDLKNRIQDILRCYRNFWDPFAELLQNSVDSINRRYRIYNDEEFYLYDTYRENFDGEIKVDESYKGKIKIEVWPEEQIISISDNGVGIEKEKIEKIVLPEGTDKKKGKEYGYKGKGLTYVAFISDKFDIKTRFFLGNNDTYNISLDGLFNWLNDDDIEFPNKLTPDVIKLNENMKEFNTTIKIKMRKDYSDTFSALSSLDQTFDLLKQEELIKSFCAILRSKTAIGNTKYLYNKQPIVPIDINLIVYNDNEVDERIIPYRFYHPKENEQIASIAYEFNKYVLEERNKAGFEGKVNALSIMKVDQQIGQRSPIVLTDIHLTAISTWSLNRVNENLKLIDEFRDAGFTYGVYLSIDGMPTGIRLDNWDTKGSVNKRYYAIVDASLDIGNELDAGRKGISYTRAIQISDKVIELRYEKAQDKDRNEVGDKFSAYANQDLVNRECTTIDDIFEDEDDFESRVRKSWEDTEADLKNYNDRLKYIKENFSLERLPRTEEEVRTLFHEMIAKGIIKGYRTIYDASTRADYDSALSYRIDIIDENTEPTDPIGIGKQRKVDLNRKKIRHLDYKNDRLYKALNMNSNAICTEFKYSLDNLMYEINRPYTSKDPKKMDLIIVWDENISPVYSEDYTISAIQENLRYLHGVTHKVNITNPWATSILCISLSYIIDKLIYKNK